MCCRNRRARRHGPIVSLAIAGYAAYNQHQAKKQQVIATSTNPIVQPAELKGETPFAAQFVEPVAEQQRAGYDYNDLLSTIRGTVSGAQHTNASRSLAKDRVIYDEKHQEALSGMERLSLNNDESDHPPTYYAYADQDPATTRGLPTVAPGVQQAPVSHTSDPLASLLSSHNVSHNSAQLAPLITMFISALGAYRERQRQDMCGGRYKAKRARKNLVDAIVEQEVLKRGGAKVGCKERKRIRCALRALESQLDLMIDAELAPRVM